MFPDDAPHVAVCGSARLAGGVISVRLIRSVVAVIPTPTLLNLAVEASTPSILGECFSVVLGVARIPTQDTRGR